MEKIYTFIIILIALAGCGSNPGTGGNTHPHETPDLINHIGHYFNDFEYSGIKYYGDGLGYSLRYTNTFVKSTHADFYIWPVPSQALNFPHKDVVFAVTEASIDDIVSVKESGGYQEMEILDQTAYESKELVITFNKFALQRNGLKIVSFLYVTEYQGSLLKARVSMPDNEANRDEKKINKLVTDVFNQIIANIDRV